MGLIAAALWALRGQLPGISNAARSVHPRWSLVALASAIVLLTYAFLIECWRRVLAEMGGRLSPIRAAHIWLGSNLARYVPGSLWQLGAMGVMSQREGVAIPVATGSAVVLTIVNVLTGLAVFALTSAQTPQLGNRGMWFVVVGVIALVLAPFVLPRLDRLVRSLTGRDIVLPRIGARALIIAGVSTTVAWLAYGVAFWVLTNAVLSDAPRSVVSCIAVYTGSYLLGLLAVAPPAGIGVADGALILLAPQFGVATVAEASVLAVIVRIWRTVLEVVPGIVALGIGAFVQRDRVDEKAPDR
ncbi:MAG: lysylphosphatidylglycerol synthase domain-containing protein [bacterium]